MIFLLLLGLGTAGAAFLLCAALGALHERLDFQRTGAITALTCALGAAACFAGDPLPGAPAKESLYLGLPAVAALLVYLGLKLNERFRNKNLSLLVVPVLAGAIAPALYLAAHSADLADYQPPRHTRPKASKLSRALSKTKRANK